MGDLNHLLKKIQKTDARRQDLRTRLLGDEIPQSSRGSYDAELAALNHAIESYAREVNRTLEGHARGGTKPGKVKVGAVLDAELKGFLEQVQKTCAHLDKANPLGGAPTSGTAEASALARSKGDANKLRRESQQRQRECQDEQRKTERAREDLARDKKRVEQERQKVEQQRQKLDEQRKKVEKENEQTTAKKSALQKEQARLDREKREMLNQLKSLTEARRRPVLEQRIQQTTNAIRQSKHAETIQDQTLERYRRMLDSMDRELEQLAQAFERVDDELARLDDEDGRLEERLEQIQQAQAAEAERMAQLTQAELSLRKATTA